MTTPYSKLEQFVCRRIPEQLYRHCVATAQTALDLAKYHGIDPRKARDAGLLHDIARSLDDATLLKEATRLDILVSEVEETVPVLLHAKVGAKIAERELGISDPETIEAIAVHTTGSCGMGLVARVVFVTDYAEPTRDLAGADEVRALLPGRLDEAVLSVLRHKIQYVLESGAPVDPHSVELWNELVQKPLA